MDIIDMKINEIVPYEHNPRKNDNAVNAVANSIKEFGFKVPIIIDKNNIKGIDINEVWKQATNK